MQLVVDIGNSNIVVGVYSDGVLAHVWRLQTNKNGSIEEYKEKIVKLLFEANASFDDFSLVVLGSVVPELTQPFEAFLAGFFNIEPVTPGPNVYDLLELEILRPHEIGADIVANAYAARKNIGANVLVIDFGTALTFTAVGEDWKLHGVSIAPGLGTAMRSLRMNTARLSEVELTVPDSVMGRDTTHAIQSGVLIGYTGLVEKMISEYKRQWRNDLLVVATGGQSSILRALRPHLDEIRPNLTLDGFHAIGTHVALVKGGD